MYFVSGFISFLFGMLMLFSLKLLSVAFPLNVTVVDGNGNESASSYFQFDVMIYPILLMILGVIMIFVHFRTKK